MSEKTVQLDKDIIEQQLLQKALKIAAQQASSLNQLIFLEALRGLRLSGLERVNVLANALLLSSRSQEEHEELNKLKLIAGRLQGAKVKEDIVGVVLPKFVYEEPSFLTWLRELEIFTKDELAKVHEQHAQKRIQEYLAKNQNASLEIELIKKATYLEAFTYPSLEVVVSDFAVWSEDLLLQKLARVLGEKEEEQLET
jgi:hypothetical protein